MTTRLQALGERIKRFLHEEVWSPDLTSLPTFRAVYFKISRVLYLAGRGFVEDRCLFRASALAYITVLSLVPLLAFGFSVAKGLGAYDTLMHGTIEPFLERTVGPVGPVEPGTGGEATPLRQAIDQLFDFVAATNVGSLGLFGLAFLAYTVIKLLSTIERSFNDIWGVRRSRSFVRKASDYLSMVVIVPILLVSATAVTTALQSTALSSLFEGTGGPSPVRELFVKFVSLAVMWIGFGVLYLVMPNTRTRIVSAAIGGVAGGTLWFLAQILHVRFQVGMANYNALYSGFAAIPIFLLWIYVSWITVLFGAEFAFAHQNEPAYRQIARSRHLDEQLKEVLGLRAVVRVGVAFLRGRPPYRAAELASELGVPERTVDELLARLQERGIVAALDEGFTAGVLPARALASIRVKDVVDAIAGRGGRADFPPRSGLDAELDRTLARFDEHARASAENATIESLAQRAADEAAADAPDEER